MSIFSWDSIQRLSQHTNQPRKLKRKGIRTPGFKPGHAAADPRGWLAQAADCLTSRTAPSKQRLSHE